MWGWWGCGLSSCVCSGMWWSVLVSDGLFGGVGDGGMAASAQRELVGVGEGGIAGSAHRLCVGGSFV